MRAHFTILLLFATFFAMAQPANDDCSGAISLTLTEPAPCPNEDPVSDNFTYSNVNATAASPYPALPGCSVGGSLAAPAAEVWFTFVTTANVTTVTINGLNTPNIAYATGTDCTFLSWQDCANPSVGSGTVTLTINSLIGESYYLLVSGGNIGDTGSFDIEISSQNDCDICLLASDYYAQPPPLNGTYSSGQTVNFFYTITNWDVTESNDWLHALTVKFGSGWDMSTLVTFPPASCDGAGTWGWYDNWTSCYTGMTFGPGFAYEAGNQSGGCCVGGIDSNPGNNYGDGWNNCAQIGTPSNPSVTFQWQITVADCPPNMTGSDLRMNVNVWSDAESGCWGAPSCNSGSGSDLLASATCCTDANPVVIPTPTSCPGYTDGSLAIQGGGGVDPFALYDFVVFDQDNNIVFTCEGCAGTVVANNLPSGTYTINAVNVVANCSRSATVVLTDAPAPTAIPMAVAACEGDGITLQGSVNPFDALVTYSWSWSGPNGYTSIMQSPDDAFEEGDYILTVTADGCPSEPATVNVAFVQVNSSIDPVADVCPGDMVNLSATGEAGYTYSWLDVSTGISYSGNPVSIPVEETTTNVTLTTTDPVSGCTAEETVTIPLLPTPDVTISVLSSTLCEGEPISFQASGSADAYEWPDLSTSDTYSATFPAGPNSVMVTASLGACSADFTHDFTVAPALTAIPTANVSCQANGIQLLGNVSPFDSGETYNWSWSGIGFTSNQQNPVDASIPGIFTLVVESQGCVSEPATVSVNFEEVTFSVDNIVSVCPGQQTSLFAFGEATYTYQWLDQSTGITYPGNPVFLPVTEMTNLVVLTVTDQSTGCQGQESITVPVSPVPTVQIVPNNTTYCEQELISFSVFGTANNYVWNGSVSGVSYSDFYTAGFHSVSVVGELNGCTAEQTYNFQVAPVIIAGIDASALVVCAGEDVTLTGTGGNFYDWSTGDMNQNPIVITPDRDTTITVYVASTEGCTDEESISISVEEPLPDPDINCLSLSPTSVEFSWDPIPGVSEYFITSTAGPDETITETSIGYSGLSAGEVVTITVEAISTGNCPNTSATSDCSAIACDPLTLDISPVADICLDGNTPVDTLEVTIAATMDGDTTWSGPGITDAALGIFDPEDAGPGMHEIILTYSEDICPYFDTIFINVFETPTADFIISQTELCLTDSLLVTYSGSADSLATYIWDFDDGLADPGNDEGPHMVTWTSSETKTISLTVEADGCTSEPFSMQLEVSDTISAPVINCGASTTTSVTFEWGDVPGASDYSVTPLTAHSGTRIGNSYFVENLNPGEQVEIEVTAINPNACPDNSATFICQADDCPVFTFNFTAVDDICRDGTNLPFDLAATVTGGYENGTYEWSGAPITDAANGTFDPDLAQEGANVITLTYMEGPCSDIDSITINVFDVPDPTFTLSMNEACTSELLTVEYTGGADPANSTFIWGFDGGNAVPGSGEGPHEVSWASSGMKTVTLMVQENGCTSETFSLDINITENIAPPVISCGPSSTTSVTFEWEDVVGATDYSVNVVSGPAGTRLGNTYTMDNLMPGETVEIEVIALSPTSCPDVSAFLSCSADPCPVFNFDIPAVDDICRDGMDLPFDLSGTVTGGEGNGTYEWSGTAITNASAGTFDPAMATYGPNLVTLTYTEGPCNDIDSLMINVYDVPDPAFTLSLSEACIDDVLSVEYTGGADPSNSIFVWDFDEGNAIPGNGAGPHDISWSTAGMKTVSLTVEQDGCTSELFSQQIDISESIQAPVISCGPSSTTSVTFEWEDVVGATGYSVNVISGPLGTRLGNTYTIDNLMPEEQVEIEVIALSPSSCPDVSASLTCAADPCPVFVFDIPAVNDICRDETNLPFDLTGTVTGGEGNGSYEWSGLAITDVVAGTFDPALALEGANVVTLSYTEGPCADIDSITINVFDVPNPTFTISSAFVCTDQTVMVEYTGGADPLNSDFNWNFNGGTAIPGTDVGPHDVSWSTGGTKTISLIIEENGCVSEQFSLEVEVDTPLPIPVINCNSTVDYLEFTWNDIPGADSFNVTVITGQTGVETPNSITFENLVDGEEVTVQVEAVTTSPCGNSVNDFTCYAIDCPDVSLIIGNVDTICLAGTLPFIDLEVTATGGAGGGTENWVGPGITDGMTGMFDPNAAGPGDHPINVTYQEGSCAYFASILITIYGQPTADFTADETICLTDFSNILYTGTGAVGADYDWEFDGGQVLSGTDQGPYEIQWTDFGLKTVSLVVTENDCASELFSVEVMVVDTLQPPQISCDADNTSITFSWEEVTAATEYQVIGPSGDRVGNTYTVSGLVPEEEVSITVIAVSGGPCANSSATLSCTTDPCASVTFDIDPVADLCIYDSPMNLSATAIGGLGGGTFTWSEEGITDGALGTFDPGMVVPGDITINIDYTEVNGLCQYDTFTVISVYPQPTADFTVVNPICVDDASSVEYTGSASALANYNWDFDGGTATPGTGVGPHAVSWNTSGTKTITLTVEEDGCTSELFSQEVVVEPLLDIPQISCESTTSSITFSWDPVPGAIDYQVDPTGASGLLNGTTYFVDDLDPEQSVSIELTAVSGGECGNSVATASCSADPCPSMTLTLSGDDVLCLGSSTLVTLNFSGAASGPFDIEYTINAGAIQNMNNVTDGSTISLGTPTENTTIDVTTVTDLSTGNCVYAGDSWTVIVFDEANSGIAGTSPEFCQGAGAIVALGDLLSDADPGGFWLETSSIPSTGGAFNATNGTFNPLAQASGTYSFAYFIDAPDPCPDAQTEVSVVVNPNPQADAGFDQELNCNMGLVSIGSANTSPGMEYQWTVIPDSIAIADPGAQIIDVSLPGAYTLTATNPATGCSDSDQVLVNADFEVPVPQITISGISCFHAHDGAIFVESVSGGNPPYTYSLNGAPPVPQNYFTNLGPGVYTLVVGDASGCFSEIDFNMEEPDEIVVTLVTNVEGEDDNVIQLGETIQLTAAFDPNILLDTILWQPDSLANGKAITVDVAPAVTSLYSVTIIDTNGCSDSDNLTVFVRNEYPVYFPTAFSPNNDGINDYFFIQGGTEIQKVNSFLIFNRWGESIIELHNFQPNDPSKGWDGKFRGQDVNPAVYTYFAEIEFKNGEIIMFKGDVAVLR